jgi:hypothetical protein
MIVGRLPASNLAANTMVKSDRLRPESTDVPEKRVLLIADDGDPALKQSTNTSPPLYLAYLNKAVPGRLERDKTILNTINQGVCSQTFGSRNTAHLGWFLQQHRYCPVG